MLIDNLRMPVVKLLDDDVYDVADKAWVCAVFVSLHFAETLGYKEDTFIKLKNRQEKHETLLAIVKDNLLLPTSRSPKQQKYWSAGHFYNNALFRIVALAETRLPVLYKLRVGVRPQEDYFWLSRWYEKTFGESLELVYRAREQVNRLKHDPHYKRRNPKADLLEEGIDAFREVITLLERMVAIKPYPGVLRLFNILSQEEAYSISDEESLEKFLTKLKAGFQNAKNNPIPSPGARIQELFMHVLASLEECSFIKQEDSGNLFPTEGEIRAPSLRIILHDNTEMFIEVINYRPKDIKNETYKLKSNYVDSLLKYTGKFGKDLKFAVYWSQMNIWTLLSIDSFTKVRSCYRINFSKAYKKNEMSLVGDYMLATVPLLKFRIITDPQKPRNVEKYGKVGFTIKEIELYVNERLIEDRKERNIAYFLMLFSNWISEEPTTNIESHELISIDFTVKPQKEVSNQNFQMMGYLSTMISKHFDSITASEGEIEGISPSQDHGLLGIRIPKDYIGKYLQIQSSKLTT